MSEVDVFLRADAFVGMVVAVAEGFKSEVGGLLFGDDFRSTKERKLVVNQAIPLVSTTRTPSEVQYNARRTDIVRSLWDNLTTYWPLGGFHSHPEYGSNEYEPVPSKDDVAHMDPDEIEVIISIKEAVRHDTLGYKREGKRISGAVGDYHIEMASWFCDEENNIVEAELWCPYVWIINLAYELNISITPGLLFEDVTHVHPRDLRTLRHLVNRYESGVLRSLKEEVPVLTEIKKKLKEIKRYDRDQWINQE